MKLDEIEEFIPNVRDMANIAIVEREKIKQGRYPRELRRIGEKINGAACQGKRELTHKTYCDVDVLIADLRRVGYQANSYVNMRGQFIEICW